MKSSMEDKSLEDGDSQPAHFASRGLDMITSRNNQRRLLPHSTASIFAVLCAVCTGLVTWLVDRNAKVCIPVWLVTGVCGGIAMSILQKAFWVVVQQLKNLGFGGMVQLMERKVLKKATTSSWAASSKTSTAGQSMYLAPSHTQAPRPELPQHPLVSGDGGKDWFRLMQKAVLDTISSKDVSKCSTQQIYTLMPPLVLRTDFEFTLDKLGKRLLECNSLAIRALCFTWSQLHGPKQNKMFVETTLSKERVGCWASYIEFYESCCRSDKSVPQTLKGDQLPKGLLSPFTGTSAPVEQVTLKKRFCSGHGPTVVGLKYRRVDTTKEHNLCKGDIVEAFIDGNWTHGTIMEVTENTFGFRDSAGEEHMDIVPEHIRPWPQSLLLKPDAVDNDMTCFCMFRIFNYLWRHSFIPTAFIPCALDVEVLPAGAQFGFMEFIDDCETAQHYDWAQLHQFGEKQMQVFLRTAAGSLIAGHVLGIGDRHQDNIMLRKVELPNTGECTQFFQLDFKHYLGRRARIDANPMAIPQKMKDALEHLKVNIPSWEDVADDEIVMKTPGLSKEPMNNKFEELVALCGMAFRVLRRSNSFVMHFVRLLNLDDHHTSVWESHLMKSLCFDMKEDDAVECICHQVKHSASSFAKFVKDVSHAKRRSA